MQYREDNVNLDQTRPANAPIPMYATVTAMQNENDLKVKWIRLFLGRSTPQLVPELLDVIIHKLLKAMSSRF